MTGILPRKVLLSGGHEIGGVASFAESLCAGFSQRGIPAEIVAPSQVFRRIGELRDPGILKILSTTAVFAAPLARRAICMAHGVPRADYQGYRKLLAIIASFRLANRSSGARLVSVSHFTAATLRAVFAVRTDAVIHNPVKPLFAESFTPSEERCYITYAGRLIAAKNPHRIFPAVRELLDENPGLRACIVGEGELRMELERIAGGDPRFEFKSAPDDRALRGYLRKTKVFVSGNEVEGFGITYLEAMTQGCVVAMPAGGGGLEIAPERVGSAVQLFPLSWDHDGVLATLRRALQQQAPPLYTGVPTVEAAAGAYLSADALFFRQRAHGTSSNLITGRER